MKGIIDNGNLNNKDNLSFEDRVDKVKAIVNMLNDTSISLKDGMKLYEEGMKELKEAQIMLEEAQIIYNEIKNNNLDFKDNNND